MADLVNTFWQFDSAEFARMHESENRNRKAWLKKKIEQCNKKLNNKLKTEERHEVMEDLNYFKELLSVMFY